MKHHNVWTLAVSIFLLGTSSVWADADHSGYGSDYGMHMFGSGWHGMLMGPLMMIAFIVVTIIAVVLILRGMGVSDSSDRTPKTQSPEDILKERFAKGEIDEAEYRHRADTLSKS